MSALLPISVVLNSKIRWIAKRLLLFTFLLNFTYGPLRAAVGFNQSLNTNLVQCLDQIIKTRKGKKCLNPKLVDRHEQDNKSKSLPNFLDAAYAYHALTPEIMGCHSKYKIYASCFKKLPLFILYPQLRI